MPTRIAPEKESARSAAIGASRAQSAVVMRRHHNAILRRQRAGAALSRRDHSRPNSSRAILPPPPALSPPNQTARVSTGMRTPHPASTLQMLTINRRSIASRAIMGQPTPARWHRNPCATTHPEIATTDPAPPAPSDKQPTPAPKHHRTWMHLPATCMATAGSPSGNAERAARAAATVVGRFGQPRQPPASTTRQARRSLT